MQSWTFIIFHSVGENHNVKVFATHSHSADSYSKPSTDHYTDFFLFHGMDTIKAKILWYIGSLVKMSALKLTLGERSLATPGD